MAPITTQRDIYLPIGEAPPRAFAGPLAGTDEALKRFLDAADYDWSDFRGNLRGARARVERLQALHESFVALPEAWSTTPKTERQALVEAAGTLMRTVAEALDPDRPQGLPSLASLGLGPDDFSEHARVGAAYFGAVGRLLQVLTPMPKGSRATELEKAAGQARETLVRNLRRIRAKWTDTWAAIPIPVELLDGIDPEPSMRELLGSELFRDEQRAYHANEIDALWGIDLDRARRLQSSGRNACGGGPATGSGQYRIDCYAFAVTADAAESYVAAELRIVYRTVQRDAPVELWYALPIPDGLAHSGRQRLQEKMLGDFFQAVKQAGLKTRGSGNKARIKSGHAGARGRAWRVVTIEKQNYYLDGRIWFIIRIVEG